MQPVPLKRIFKWLVKLEDLLLAFLLTGMILLAALQIILRNFFDTGIAWADPSLRIAVLWLAMLGAMAATRDGNHIHIDLLSRLLPPKGKSGSRRATDFFSAIVCGLLAWHAGRFVYFEWQDGSTLFAAFPAWLAEIILPVGFAVIALRFLVATIVQPARDQNS